jgi:NTE family protein
MERKKKLGFALGAGGSRGIAHIGFLAAMEEAGIKPDYIAGCSMGSVIGAAYASGMRVEDMKHAAFKLKLFDLIAPAGGKGGLFDTRKIRKLLSRYIGEKRFEELEIPYRCVAVDMLTQSVVEFSQGPVIDGVVASSCIPSVFRPVEKDGMRLIDGGILERVPYKRVKDMGADVVVAVDVLGWRACKEKCPGTIGILLETIDIMDNYRTKHQRERDKGIYNFWLEPELGDMSQYSFKQFEFAYQKGYEIGKEYAKKIKRKCSF